MISRFLCAAFLALVALPSPAAWKAGVARVNITPSESIWMAGYSSRDHPSEGVYAPLYAKAWSELVPQAEVVTLDGAGHMLPLEQPGAAAEALLGFFGSAGDPG